MVWVSLAFADRKQHPPAAEWKVLADSGARGGGPWRGQSCHSGARSGPSALTLQLSSTPLSPEQHNQLLVLVHIYSPCHMADFQKTSQQQSLLCFRMNSSQINDTKEGEASLQAQTGELAHTAKNFMGNCHTQPDGFRQSTTRPLFLATLADLPLIAAINTLVSNFPR